MSSIFYATTAGSVVLLFTVMSFGIRESSILWLLRYVTEHSAVPLKFILYYICVLLIGLRAGLPVVARLCRHRQSIARKYFHLLAIILFVPSILLHIRFTSLAFAVGFAVLLVLEAFRSSGVQPVARILTEVARPYLDTRDAGIAVLTHMYLLLGCAVPVWYSFFVHGGVFNAISLLIALSGITVTGIGDSCASIVGSLYGRWRWPGRKKTVEGTAAFFLSIFVFQVFMLYVMGFQSLSAASWVRLLLADLLVCTLEALTDQIDNLILPLYHCALLQMV